MNPAEAARAAWDRWRETVQSAPVDPSFIAHLTLLRPGFPADDLKHFRADWARLDELIRENNRDENLPRLRRWDDQGRRIEAVDFHPSYHEIGRGVYRTGIMSRYAETGRELETLALLYLLAQSGEGGHACPLACTAGLIKILQEDGADTHAAWLARLYDPDYDTHYHGAQFLTEAQGGSDVGANAVEAEQSPEGWRIYGEKWFCSVIDAQLYLLTARPRGERDGTQGVRAFVVPRLLSDGSPNAFRIRRLKYKLGTRSMASAEVDFEGALAVPVGDFRRVVQVVLNTSRLYNSVCSAAMLQRSYREAHAYALHRQAFSRPILEFPSVARIVARLRTEALAARALTFALADLADQIALGQASEQDQLAWRMLVNLNKFWTAHAATTGIRDAIEVLGGNGAIEEFSVLPRLLRDSIVCEAWEGGHNVLCAQTLRDAQRAGLHRPMFDWLQRLTGDTPELSRCRERWEHLVALPPSEASVHIRDLCEELRPVAQSTVLRTLSGDSVALAAAEHLQSMHQSGYDPLMDAKLTERVKRLLSA